MTEHVIEMTAGDAVTTAFGWINGMPGRWIQEHASNYCHLPRYGRT